MKEKQRYCDVNWLKLVSQLAPKHNKLAIIVGEDVSEVIFDDDCVTVDLNIYLTQALLNIAVSKRPIKLVGILGDIFRKQASPYIMLFGLEVLFEPSLQIQVVDLLKQLSHNITIVVIWPGDFYLMERGGKLSYSQLWHAEYQDYTITVRDDFEVIPYQTFIKDTA